MKVLQCIFEPVCEKGRWSLRTVRELVELFGLSGGDAPSKARDMWKVC